MEKRPNDGPDALRVDANLTGNREFVALEANVNLGANLALQQQLVALSSVDEIYKVDHEGYTLMLKIDNRVPEAHLLTSIKEVVRKHCLLS